jgi:hypothetical protein
VLAFGMEDCFPGYRVVEKDGCQTGYCLRRQYAGVAR